MCLRRASVLCVAAALLLIAAPASATESTIYPGVGIGKVKLGMTQAQVVRALGRDYIVNGRSGGTVELGWNFGSWTATLLRKRVVQVAVTVQSQKTPNGVGPGSSWRRLVRAYPHGVCTTVIDTHAMRGWNEYLVPHAGGTQTIYLGASRQGGFTAKASPWRVTEVHVRTAFARLPEFQRDWPYQCRKDWRTADSP